MAEADKGSRRKTGSEEGEFESAPTQRTPEGLEIPVPKWRDVLRDLEKVAKPSERRDDRRRPAK